MTEVANVPIFRSKWRIFYKCWVPSIAIVLGWYPAFIQEFVSRRTSDHKASYVCGIPNKTMTRQERRCEPSDRSLSYEESERARVGEKSRARSRKIAYVLNTNIKTPVRYCIIYNLRIGT